MKLEPIISTSRVSVKSPPLKEKEAESEERYKNSALNLNKPNNQLYIN